MASAPLVKLQSVFFSQSLLDSWQGQEIGSNCLVTMTQQEIETCQTSQYGRGILKSKVDRGCSPQTSVMQTLHKGNSCTTGLCLGKASSHRRCITKHIRTGKCHNSDSKGNVSHWFPTCGQIATTTGLDSGERTLPTLPATRLASRTDAVSREFCGAITFWEHLGKVSFRVSRTSLQTGQLTALRRWNA